MLLEVDINQKPSEVRLFICNPQRETLGELKEAYSRKITWNYGGISQLEFKIPYKIQSKLKYITNPHVDLIRGDFLIRHEKGTKIVYFIITSPGRSGADGKEELTVVCEELQYEWRSKLIRDYKGTKLLYNSVGVDGLLNETILTKTDWTIDYVDSSLNTKYRTFDESQRNLLEFVYDSVDRYGAYIPVIDTVNKKVSIYLDENLGIFEGLEITHGKYLKSLQESENFDDVVTRLYIYGKDNISINEKNASGTDYLESFDFYLYPFERDANRNVIKSSNYMSNSLCHAILDYNVKLETKSTEFNNLLSQKTTHQTTLTTKENEMYDLENALTLIRDRIDIQQANGILTNHIFVYGGVITTKTTSLLSSNKYVAMCKVSSVTNLAVKLDGVAKTLSANSWAVLGKLTSVTSSSVEVSGIATNVDVKILYVKITDTEYSTAGNEATLIDTYSEDNKLMQISAKQSEIDSVNTDIASVDSQIATLRSEIAIENNFTAAQIVERNRFIKERVWQDNNYTSVDDLLEEGKRRLIQISQPIVSYQVDSIDFINALNTQKDWDRLKLGGIVTIRYPKFNIDIKAKIITISHDIDDNKLNLTIANHKDTKSGFLKIKDLLKRSVNTSTQIDMSRFKWDQSETNSTTIDGILNNVWKTAERAINSGVNESVTVDRRGITIKDPTDPLKFVRMTHGVIGITNDGGNTYKQVMDGTGVYAERLVGKIILGSELHIADDNGTFDITGNLLTVKDSNNNIRTQLGEYATGKFGLLLKSKVGNQTVLDEDGIMQSWQEGEEDNVDSTNPIVLDVYVPPEATRISKGILRFRLKSFRTYSKGASSGGGSTVTSTSGGSTIPTSDPGVWTLSPAQGLLPDFMNYAGSHSHTISTDTVSDHNHGIASGTALATSSGGSVTFVSSGGHGHGGSTSTTGDHAHSMYSVRHTHDVTIPSHSHDVSIPSHTHGIIYGIYTSTPATNVKVVINGTDRTADLGGGTGGFIADQDNLNIAPYLVSGWNTISLSSTQLGRISARVFLQCFVTM
jgi:hypothetical protein